MKVVLDRNMSTEWVVSLASEEIEAVHWSTIGDWSADDDEIVRWAASNGCIILTKDLDFGAILRALSIDQPSVILLRSRNGRPHRQVRDVVAVLRRFRLDLESGVFLVLDPDRHRVRKLPLT